MIRASQIPDEVVEAAAKAIYEAWCAFHGVTKTSMPWEDIDDEERQACIAEAIASIAAAINAWPGIKGCFAFTGDQSKEWPDEYVDRNMGPAFLLPIARRR